MGPHRGLIALALTAILASPTLAAFQFSAPLYVQGIAGPYHMFGAQLDGDGIPDVVYRSAGVLVQFSSGSGWAAPVAYGITASGAVGDIVAGDADGDGDVDLVVGVLLAGAANGVYVLLNDGGGDFSTQRFVPIYDVHTVYLADLDHIGEPDLVVLSRHPVTSNILVHELRSIGTSGTYDDRITQLPGTFPWGGVKAHGRFASGAVSGAAMYSRDAQGQFDILSTVVTPGGFAIAPLVNLGTFSIQTTTTGDVNGDGVDDMLVLYTTFEGLAQVIYGGASGVFQPGPSVTTGQQSPGDAKLGDLDLDGHLDLVVVGGAPSVVRLLRGNGDGTFTAAGSLPARGGSRAVALEDVNGDGLRDLLVASDSSGTRLLGWRLNQSVALGVGGPKLGALALSVAPNPSAGETSVELAIPPGGAAWARIRVMDVTGREVARLHDGPLPAGSARLRWNGHSGSGRVAPGVYLVVMDGSLGRTGARIVRMR